MEQRTLAGDVEDMEGSVPLPVVEIRKSSVGAVDITGRQAYNADAEGEVDDVYSQSFLARIRRLFSPQWVKPNLRDEVDVLVAATLPNGNLLFKQPQDQFGDQLPSLQLTEPAGGHPHQLDVEPRPEDLNTCDSVSTPPSSPENSFWTTLNGCDSNTIVNPENPAPEHYISPVQKTPQASNSTDSGLEYKNVVPIPNFDHYKLETEFDGDHVVHTTHKWELSKRSWETSTYRQEREIGRGAFGSVWLQKEQGGGQLRAVKSLHRSSLSRAGPSQELLALVKLKDYDYLFVKFLGWYENTDHIFLAMEYIEYGDLGGYISKDPRKAKAEVKEITKQILQGLKVLHKKKIYHRDLKPQNILIASQDPIWVKIADFGISKQAKGTMLRTMMCGTEGYIAPELFGFFPKNFNTRELVGHALDIWSLGSLVHKLLTSKIPFATHTYGEDGGSETGVVDAQLQYGINMSSFYDYYNGRIPFPAEALENSHAGEGGISFIESLLAPNPNDRPTAASALQNPWLKKNEYRSGWYEDLKREFLHLGVNLSSKGILMRQARKADILQFLPSSVKENITYLLLQAVEKGCNSVVLKLLQSPGNVLESIDSSARGKLFQQAAEAGQLDTIKILLDYKADVGANIGNQSVLQWAVKDRQIGIVMLFLENEADSSPTTDYKTAFQLAVKSGQADLVRGFLGKRTEIHVEAGLDDDGHTALQAAARGGHSEVCRLLLDSGANQSPSKKGDPIALQLAAMEGHIDIVKLLLDNYTDVNVTTELTEGRTALQAAAENGHLDIVGLLLDNNADVNAAAASSGGRTALQAAAEGGHLDIVRLLLYSGADVNAAAATQNMGRTALQAAVKSGNSDIVELLLENKADVNATASNRCRKSLKVTVAESKSEDSESEDNDIDIFYFDEEIAVLERVKDLKAVPCEYGKDPTALQIAAEEGHTDIVKLLLGNSPNVNATAQSDGGRTALQAAAENGYFDIVKLLLDNNADVNAPAAQYNGQTALQAGRKSGNKDLIRILKEASSLAFTRRFPRFDTIPRT